MSISEVAGVILLIWLVCAPETVGDILGRFVGKVLGRIKIKIIHHHCSDDEPPEAA